MGWNPMMKGCEKGFTHQRIPTGWKPVPHDQSPDGNGGVDANAEADAEFDEDAAWEAYYEWAVSQCWGPNCETTGGEQFRAAMQKKLELGLPLDRSW